MTDKPWGHKVTVHIYVPGDMEAAVEVSDLIADRLGDEDMPRVGFVGVGIDTVAERPYDQGAS